VWFIQSYWIGAALSTVSPELCVAGTQISHEMDASNSACSRGGVLAWGCGILSWELFGSWELGWDSLSSSTLDRSRDQVVTKLRYRTAQLPDNLRSDYAPRRILGK
jgi:hypothetical protein